MKKNLKKGFVMAETIIVSIVVLTALIIMYTQFIKVNNNYYRTFKYNTVNDLYSVNNVKNFIENDSLNLIIKKLEDKNYLNLTSCSADYFNEFAYCKILLDSLNIKTLLFTYEDTTNLKEELKVNNNLSEGLLSFIKAINAEKNNKYRLIVEFKNDSYATLKIGSFIVSNLTNNCAKKANICTLDQIKNGVSIDIAVNELETYSFNVINDDGIKLTLIKNDDFLDNVLWSSSNNIDPTNLINYLETGVSNWVNVLDMTYNLNGDNESNYNNCDTYNTCTNNVYSITSRNAKARLPLLQELVNLGCNENVGSCPSWLNNNSNVGYWTSTTSDKDVWIINHNNRVNKIPVNSEQIKIKPVIMINKNLLD